MHPARAPTDGAANRTFSDEVPTRGAGRERQDPRRRSPPSSAARAHRGRSRPVGRGRKKRNCGPSGIVSDSGHGVVGLGLATAEGMRPTTLSASSFLTIALALLVISCDARQLSTTETSALCTVISDPAIHLDDYGQFSPEKKMGDPRAQSASYVYLVAGQEAVAMAGPAIPFSAPVLTVRDPGIAIDNPSPYAADGYIVFVNEHLQYQVRIDDFEREVALARVELCPTGTELESRFVFPATGELPGGGVAHELTIHARVDGLLQAATSPITVEAR